MVSYVVITYTICEFIDIYHNYNDLYVLTQNCCLTFLHIIGVYKVFNIMFRGQELLDIVDFLKDMSTKYAVTSKQLLELRKTEKFVKTITTLFYSLVMGTALLACLTLIMAKYEWEDRPFPFRAFFPDFIPRHFAIYLLVVGMTWSTFPALAHDCLFMGLMNYICSHLEILELSMIPLADKNFEKPTDKLISCIEHHQLIIKFTYKVEKYFTYVILGQFFTSMIITGLTAFQIIVAVEVSAAQATVIAYMGCISSELFIYCWFGNQVLEKVISFYGK